VKIVEFAPAARAELDAAADLRCPGILAFADVGVAATRDHISGGADRTHRPSVDTRAVRGGTAARSRTCERCT
jgi:hypothetical protein